MPNIGFHTNYTQVSNLHQYQNGIFDKSTEYDAINGMYDFTLSSSIPLYLGGKLKNNEKKAKINTENSKLKTQIDERVLKMQIITAFLQIHHLKEQQSLIQQKMKEDSANIKETKILKKKKRRGDLQ